MATGEYSDELRGALFKNKDKTPGDKRPDYKGFATIQGVRYESAAWLRTAKSGEKYMSISYELPRDQQGAAPAPTQAAPVQAAPVVPAEDPEDIPF